MMEASGKYARILYVMKILSEQSDELHPISAAEIIEKLGAFGISAERKAIYRDIAELCDFGMDIAAVKTPKTGYCLMTREFDMPEVALLADAVQSAGFIPRSLTAALVGKLEHMVSRFEAEEIKQRVCIENRSKCSNEAVYTIINDISEAITKRKKVKLSYVKNTYADHRIVRTEKAMTVSPYALVWDSDRYYLIGNNQKYDNLLHLRVDRIASLTVTGETVRHFNEVSSYNQRFDTADYVRMTFNMFGGEQCRIDLECKKDLLDRILDKFGENIFIRSDSGSDTFRFSADAMVSDGLIGWIMQFGGDITVLSPESLRQSVYERAKLIADGYLGGSK